MEGSGFSIAIAVIAGVPGVLGLILQQVNRKRERDEARTRELAAAPDKKLQQCWDDNDDLRRQLREADSGFASLRAMHQQLIEDYDSALGENRELRRKIEDLRTSANRTNSGQPS